jgi:hypothetical protein
MTAIRENPFVAFTVITSNVIRTTFTGHIGAERTEDGEYVVTLMNTPETIQKVTDWMTKSVPSGTFTVDATQIEVELPAISINAAVQSLQDVTRLRWIGGSDDEYVLFKLKWGGATP